MMTTGACQNALFCVVGSRTVTWQLYWPGGRLLSGTVKLSGAVPRWAAGSRLTSMGWVSKAFFCP